MLIESLFSLAKLIVQIQIWMAIDRFSRRNHLGQIPCANHLIPANKFQSALSARVAFKEICLINCSYNIWSTISTLSTQLSFPLFHLRFVSQRFSTFPVRRTGAGYLGIFSRIFPSCWPTILLFLYIVLSVWCLGLLGLLGLQLFWTASACLISFSCSSALLFVFIAFIRKLAPRIKRNYNRKWNNRRGEIHKKNNPKKRCKRRQKISWLPLETKKW